MSTAFQHAISAFVAVAIIAPLTWMVVDRNPPYIITGGSISPQVAEPGSNITVTWTIKLLRNCPAVGGTSSVTRNIISSDGVNHSYAPVRGTFNGENVDALERTFTLPAKIASGPAKYSSTVCYPCNPVQEIWPVCFKTPQLTFEVAEEPKDK